MKKKCIFCGEENLQKMFSYERKKDKRLIIYNMCYTCRSEMLRKANTGKKHTEETKQKLREKNLGKKQSKETIEKRIKKLRIPCSEEKKKKLSLAVKGFKHTEENKIKMRLKKLGHVQSKETIKKRVDKIIGKKHPPRPKGFSEKMSKIMKIKMDNPITKEKNKKNFIYCIQNTIFGKPTDIELKIIKILNRNKIFFKRNFFLKSIKHNYPVDFFLPKNKIIIEADGDYWHSLEGRKELDDIRTKEMQDIGYKVLRFLGSEIHKNIKMVEHNIIKNLQ